MSRGCRQRSEDRQTDFADGTARHRSGALWRRAQLVKQRFIRTRLTDENGFKMPRTMESEAAARRVFKQMSSADFVRNVHGGLTAAIRGMNLLPRQPALPYPVGRPQ